MSMDLEHNNIGKKIHSENKECRECMHKYWCTTNLLPIKDTSTGLNMGKNKMNSKSRGKLRTHILTGGHAINLLIMSTQGAKTV